MDFQNNHKVRQNTSKLTDGRDVNSYLHNLQLYSIPPTENVSLQEFEELAIDRLKVLKAVEAVGLRMVKHSINYAEALRKELSDLKKVGSLKGLLKTTRIGEVDNETYDDRRRDHISHFILRLAYCRSEDLRRWFIQQEIDLFRFRFSQEREDSILHFLQVNNLNYTPIPEKEKTDLEHLLAACNKSAVTSVDGISYYKVQFEKVPDLVAKREVYVKQGYAYIGQSHVISIILSDFRQTLSQSLARANRSLPSFSEDLRIGPMLDGLSKRYLGDDYGNKTAAAGEVTVDMIDTLARKSFPPCMQELHSALRQHHHLRHWGRMQYGLFLKGIGLTLEGAMQFWRAELTRIMDGDKFEKQYAYNIRHGYGKEGKRSDYTPYSCVKIITSNAPAVGDYHGCPFRHMDTDLLKQRLQALSLNKEAVDEVTQMSKKGHCQIACGMVFKHVHKLEQDFAPQHPNHYYEESQKVLHGGAEARPVREVKVVKAGANRQQAAGGSNATADSSLNSSALSVEDMDILTQEFDD